jgi:uncharacterized protein YjbI with pentapeptide repeats
MRTSHPAVLRRVLRFVAILLPALVSAVVTPGERWPLSAAHAQNPALPCPVSPSNKPVRDFSKQDLSGKNFSRQDLTNANFSGATLKGTVFIGANLTGANFRNAHVLASSDEDVRPTDFTQANLTAACFNGMRFDGRTYFSYADFSCADFSQTDLTGKAILGPGPLRIDQNLCKPAFRSAVLDCAFVDDWPRLDLSAAPGGSPTNLTACGSQLPGRNFTHANMAGVDLSGANLTGAMLDGADLSDAGLRGATLDGASLAGANLTGAHLDSASLQCTAERCANLSSAQLQGATLTFANLSGANLSKALLTNDKSGRPATNLSYAHLRNVNLSFASLIGADFSYANFYGTYAGSCTAAQDGRSQAAPDCASAQHTTITGTRFDNAYLYGVDFSLAAITGASFSGAVLAGANFAGATIGTSADGVRTSFAHAHMQGTNLGDASSLNDVDLTNAYFDFPISGNTLYLNLAGVDHNRHACGGAACTPAAGKDVCVVLAYHETRAPAGNTSIICPDGTLAGPGGCGSARRDGSNLRWKSSTPMNSPPAWYGKAATYAPAASPATICNGAGAGAATPNW